MTKLSRHPKVHKTCLGVPLEGLNQVLVGENQSNDDEKVIDGLLDEIGEKDEIKMKSPKYTEVLTKKALIVLNQPINFNQTD